MLETMQAAFPLVKHSKVTYDGDVTLLKKGKEVKQTVFLYAPAKYKDEVDSAQQFLTDLASSLIMHKRTFSL